MELKYSHLNPLQVTLQYPHLCSSSPCLTCLPQTTDSHLLPSTMQTTTLLYIRYLKVFPRSHLLLSKRAEQDLIMEIKINNSHMVLLTQQLLVKRSSPLQDMFINPLKCESNNIRLKIDIYCINSG